MHHKRYKPAKQRSAAKICQCNPHQKALGNRRTSPQQLRERVTMREEMR